MDTIRVIVKGIVIGLRDAVLGIAAVYHLDQRARQAKKQVASENEESSSEAGAPVTVLQRRRAQSSTVSKPKRIEPKILHRILQCCALNGGIFWCSILFFHNIFLPLLQALMTTMFGGTPGLSSLVWGWLRPMLLWTFSALWVLPLFLLSRIVNSLWFQDIADSAYRNLRGRPQMLSSVSTIVADTLFSALIQALFLVQSVLVSLLPIAGLGQLVYIVHLCLLYSLYAFEYKWCNMGWQLHHRLSFIERNWPYFVGFGLPLALLTSLPSSFIISGCVFSILFPLFIISGNEATPLTCTFNYPLQLFSPVVWLSNTLFHRTIRRPSKGTASTNIRPPALPSSSSSSLSQDRPTTPTDRRVERGSHRARREKQGHRSPGHERTLSRRSSSSSSSISRD